MLAAGERRGRLDGVDADDRAAQAFLVGADARREVGHRRLVSELAPQRLARRIELAPLAADAARPGILAERVDHRAADAPFGKGFELDPALFIEALGGVDQAQHSVLNQIADVDRVRHRGGHASSQSFDKRQSGHNTVVLFGGERLSGVHGISC